MKVLVAEDDPGSRLVVEGAVGALGHDCVGASDGKEAWTLFCEYRPDIVITEWRLPGIDGLDLCRRIRAQDADGYTYVIVVSSHRVRDDVRRGIEVGRLAGSTMPTGIEPPRPNTPDERLRAARFSACGAPNRRACGEAEHLVGLASTLRPPTEAGGTPTPVAGPVIPPLLIVISATMVVSVRARGVPLASSPL